MRNNNKSIGNTLSALGETEEVSRATEVSTNASANEFVPDPEVSEKAKRHKFTAQYKLRILKEADTCINFGQIGALLRREGLYSSNPHYMAPSARMWYTQCPFTKTPQTEREKK